MPSTEKDGVFRYRVYFGGFCSWFQNLSVDIEAYRPTPKASIVEILEERKRVYKPGSVESDYLSRMHVAMHL